MELVPHAAAVIVAAGRSERMGGAVRKPFLEIAGRSLLEHACAAFASVAAVREVVLVVHADDVDRVRALGLLKVTAVVPGGAERTDSVRAGVAALPSGAEVALVHDAARPLVRPATIEAAIATAAREGAALVAVPVRDTLKSSPDGRRAVATIDRSTVWAAQTPQAFRTSVLRELLERARRESVTATDDAALHERYLGPIALVRGDESNINVTTPEDLAIAEAILSRRRSEAQA